MSDEKGISPAALAALLDGDLENARVAMTPGGIEAQEAQGQKDFVASETLPIKCNYCTREQFEQMGIVYGEPIDDLFIAVQLPEGWEKVRTDHSMWSKLVDEKGRERASIFYKAAFYDRDAFIGLTQRFHCCVEPVGGYEGNYREREWHCVVTDCGEAVWTSERRVEPEPESSRGDEEKRAILLDWYDRKDALGELGVAWLDEHYPDWHDPLAYWD